MVDKKGFLVGNDVQGSENDMSQSIVMKNNIAANHALNELNANNRAFGKSMKKLASGMKINSVGDDASNYTISEGMRGRLHALEQDSRNAQNGASLLKVAEGAISSTIEELKTLKEKAINAADDTNTDADRAVIQKEVDQTLDQIDDNANVTYNGKMLVDGSHDGKDTSKDNTLVFHVGANPGENIHIALGDMRTDALGYIKEEKDTDGNVISSTFVKLSSLSVETKDKAQEAISIIDGAIEMALDQQTTIGAVQQRMDYTDALVTTTSRNETDAESVIRDADMAASVVETATNSMLVDASSAMLAQANQKNSGLAGMLNDL